MPIKLMNASLFGRPAMYIVSLKNNSIYTCVVFMKSKAVINLCINSRILREETKLLFLFCLLQVILNVF